MKKNMQILSVIVFVLFLFPVVIQFIPEGSTMSSAKIIKENAFIVYASNIMEEPKDEEEEVKPVDNATDPSKVLLYFTHSQEAYEPMTKAADGKVAVSHQTENVMKMGEKLKNQLIVHGVETDMLDVDNNKEMVKKNIPYWRAYKEIRPHVKQKISEKDYDLIIDVHRDSIGPEATTIVHEGERYAKVSFVVGTDHANYKLNMHKTMTLKKEMDKIIPGITKNLLPKGGQGVDGKYNQDLSPNIILIELGGIGNTEDELNRTVAIIAEAATAMLENEKTQQQSK